MNIDISKGYLPDFKPYQMPQGGLVRCENLLPGDEGYLPAVGTTDLTAAVTGNPRSAIELVSQSMGMRYTFIGTASKIYRVELDNSLTDVTRTSGGDYVCGENTWSWAQYSDWLVATNGADDVQILKDFGNSALGFAALAGTPPIAKYALIVNGHLILAHCLISAARYPKTIAWSGLENVETWTIDPATGADQQDFPDGYGEITGLARIGSAFGVFHENSITIGWWEGYPTYFNFVRNKFTGVGGIPNTMVSVGNYCYWWDWLDFYVTDGVSEVIPIGTGIKSTILGSLDVTKTYKISSVYDISRGLIYWAYPTTSSATGDPDRILIYNPRKKIYTLLDLDLACMVNIHSASTLLDAMDTLWPTVDAITIPFDSSYWKGNQVLLGGVSTAGKLVSFSGSTLTGVIETAEIRGANPNDRVSIQQVRPWIESPAASSVSARIGRRNSEIDSVSYADSRSMQTSGRIPVSSSARLVRVELTTAGTHQGITGMDADVVPIGEI